MAKGFLNRIKKWTITLRSFIYYISYKINIDPKTEKELVDQFHKLYYDSHAFGKTWMNTFWLGIPVQKCPLDLWVYQEIIFELKPDIIVECGTASGGGSLFFASMCDLMNNGRIITIDTEDIEGRPQHKRITYLHGSSTSKEVVEKVENLIKEDDKVMIFLDSDHSKDHVLSELEIYSKLVTKGSYLVVEDTNINGHPVFSYFGPGPMEAIEEFLRKSKIFVVDGSKEKFYLTFNPNGYLRKTK